MHNRIAIKNGILASLLLILCLMCLSACGGGGAGGLVGGADPSKMTEAQKNDFFSHPFKPKSIAIAQLNDTLATVEASWHNGVMSYSLTLSKSEELAQWFTENPKGHFVITWERDGRTIAGFDAPFNELTTKGSDYVFAGTADCGMDVYTDIYNNREYWGLTWQFDQ
ncbi:MAG: hypothetical protein U0105_26090 [Candidatus Obscuribacterales bacterium]